MRVRTFTPVAGMTVVASLLLAIVAVTTVRTKTECEVRTVAVPNEVRGRPGSYFLPSVYSGPNQAGPFRPSL